MATDLTVPVDAQDHARGDADATVTLVEYGDYECPSCLATQPTVERLLDELPHVRFVFRHFPLTSVHAHASQAAQAAEAAAAQGQFWPMHAALYKRPGGLELDDLDRLALRLGVEVYRFQSDLTGNKYTAKIKRDIDGGRASGVTGTPTFFLNGRRLPSDVLAGDGLIQAVRDARCGSQ